MARILLLVGLVGVACACSAQDYALAWSKSISSTGSLEAVKVLVNSAGDVFVVSNQTFSTGRGVRIDKFNDAGTLLFSKAVPRAVGDVDTAVAAELGLNSDVLIAGTTLTPGNSSLENLLLISVNAGNGGVNYRLGYDLTLNRRQAAVGMAVMGPNVFIAATEAGTSAGDVNMLTAGFEASDGDLAWSQVKNFPANRQESVAGIIAIEGNLYVGGTMPVGADGSDMMAVSYTSAGVERWVFSHNFSATKDGFALGIGGLASQPVLVGEVTNGTVRNWSWIQFTTDGVLDFANIHIFTAFEPFIQDEDIVDVVASDGQQVAIGGFTNRTQPGLNVGEIADSFSTLHSSSKFIGEFVKCIALPADGNAHSIITRTDRSGTKSFLVGTRGQVRDLGNAPSLATPAVIATRGGDIYPVVCPSTSTLVVGKLRQPPKANPDAYVISVGSNFGSSATINDFGVIDPLAEITSSGGGTMTMQASGNFSYVAPGEAGVYTFAYKLTTALGFSTTTMKFFVQPVVDRIELFPATVIGGEPVVARVHFTDSTVAVKKGSVQLTNPFQSIDVTAPPGVDFVDVFFAPSPVATDTDRVVKSFLGGATKTATLRVLAAKLSSLELMPSRVIGGLPFTGVAKLTGRPATTEQVNLSDNSSAIVIPASVSVPTTASSASFNGSTTAVSTAATRQITATLDGVTKIANLTLLPGALKAIAISPIDVEGGGDVAGLISLTGIAPEPVTVATSSNSGSVIVPPSVTVSQGLDSQSFTIGTKPVSADAVRTVTASGFGRTVSATVKLRPRFTIASLTMNPTTVKGGDPSTGTVTLNQAALTNGNTVSLSDNSGSINTPPSMTVLGGLTEGTFTVATSPVSVTATRQITATLGSSTRTVTLTLTP